GAYRVQPTEGGHIDFAPLDSIEDAILARLRQRYRRVSVERVVSGPGRALRQLMEGGSVKETDAKDDEDDEDKDDEDAEEDGASDADAEDDAG
ncbi:MAG: glucokinase, partial [Lysobacteraceae bacterium]